MARRCFPSPAHPAASPGRSAPTLLAALLIAMLLAAGAACAPLGASSAPPPPGKNDPPTLHGAPALLAPGQEAVLAGCLRVRVEGFTDRSGEFDHSDWVDLRLTNGCQEVRRHLLVELVLLDPSGEPYGGLIWLLQGGEILPPGRSRRERFAIPDPDDRTPVQWTIRLRQVERPRPLRAASGSAPGASSAASAAR